MSYTAHTETQGGLTLSIIQDEDAESPRDWDNLAVLVCDHGRYNLGDEDGHRKAREAIRNSRHYKESWEDNYDFSCGPDLFKLIQECSDIVWLPLYLFDHSGITISTTRFSCPWDSGQVGFAFLTRTAILDNWPGKRLTPKLRERAEACIEGEVKTYDQYLRGEVYGYVVEDEDGDHLESCWGFYGEEEALDEGRRTLRCCLNDKEEEAAKLEADGRFLDALDIPAI